MLHVFIDNGFIFSAKSKCLCLQAQKVMFVKILDIFIHFILLYKNHLKLSFCNEYICTNNLLMLK